MSNDASYFKLGLFVICGVVLIVGGVILFGAGALFKEYVVAETATMRSVEGLQVGAAVKFSGVTIGKVSSIEMAMWQHPEADPEKYNEIRRYVIVQMQINRSTLVAHNTDEIRKNLADAISRGLRARMASSGLTGPPFIEVVFMDPKTHPSEMPPWKTSDLYVPSAPSQMSEVISGVESILAQVKDANIAETITDIRTLIKDTDKAVNAVQFKEVSDKVTLLIDEVRGTNKSVKSVVENPKIDQTIARLNELVNDPKLQKTLDGISETASSAGPAAVDLRRVLHRLDQMLAAQDEEVESIVANLRKVMEQLAAIVEDAKNNPSRVLFGAPPPQFNAAEKK